MTAVGSIVLGTVGIELTMQCIQTMTGYAQSIYSMVNCVSYMTGGENVMNVLNKYDIELKVKIIESLVVNLKLKKHSNAYKLCLEGLKECLHMLDNEMKEIKQKIEYNNAIWIFASWRSYVLSNNIKKIIELNDMLDMRKKMFFEILGIDEQLTSEESANLVRQFNNAN